MIGCVNLFENSTEAEKCLFFSPQSEPFDLSEEELKTRFLAQKENVLTIAGKDIQLENGRK